MWIKPGPLMTHNIVWSNFEIANMEFWRGEAYSKFFDYLDQKGGFYYEVRRLPLRHLELYSLAPSLSLAQLSIYHHCAQCG